MSRKYPHIATLSSIALILALMVTPAIGEEASEVSRSLGLVGDEQITTSRFPRPASQIAENVTIITADDIARLNAHTLAEVLQTVPGVQMDFLRTPGTSAFFNIQGALNTTVLVLIDGIRQNEFTDNTARVGLIPVQQIERMEIVKGAASSAWGPALGGVINIITKSSDPERAAGGLVSASLGSHLTADSRAELSGTVNRFGYYLTAGNLRSNGLTPNTGGNFNNFYSKLSYLLPGSGTATFGLSHQASSSGLDQGDTAKYGFVHDDTKFSRSSGFLRLAKPLGPQLSLEVDGYLATNDDHTKYGGVDANGGPVFFDDFDVLESSRGADARLFWGDNRYNLAAGIEYSHAHTRLADLLSADPLISDRTFDRYGFYANGAFSIGALTILPSIREDLTGVTGNNLSYTLGATYQLTDTTTLRAYAAKGYSLPLAVRQNELQKIATVQAGIESSGIPYFWLKGTYFFNAIRNNESAGVDVTVTDQNRQGFELEARTTPLLGFSLLSGYTFTYAKDINTGQRVQTSSGQSVPPHNVKLALNYDNSDSGLRGALTGNYIWWHGSSFPPVADQGMIWDLHLTWKVRPSSDLSPELFFSARNLFNGNQTTDTTLYNTAPRWFEGGARLRF